MNFLDMRTVLFSYIVSNSLCLLVMILMWRKNRRQFAGLDLWLADFLLQFLALALISLRNIIPAFFSMVISNSFAIGGTILLYSGLERFTGRTGWKKRNLILFIAFFAVHIYFAFVRVSLFARNINVSLGLLAICAQCSCLMLSHARKRGIRGAMPVGIVFGAYSVVSLVRIGFEIALPPGNELFKSGLYDTLAILIYQMLFVALTFALFLMVNDNLLSALELDIDKRKRAEESLRLSEQKFSIAFQNIPDAIVITSPESGTIIEANNGFARMSGLTKDESVGKTTFDLNLWENVRDRESFVADLRRDGKVLDFETRFRTASGTIITGLISGEMLSINGENCVLTVIHDISERKGGRGNHPRAQRKPGTPGAGADNPAGKSHGLPRSLPLLGIPRSEDSAARDQEFFRNSRREAQGVPERAGKHYLENIVEASSRMDRLIEDLLEYSRLGHTEPRFEPLSLNDIVDRVLGDLAVRIVAEEAVVKKAEHLPIVMGDSGLLMRIFSNLVDNALTFRKKGEAARIRIDWAETPGTWEISVADEGIGIDSCHHEKIFEIFLRLHDQETYPGTGIGLAAVRRSAELMGGTVKVQSELGAGSRFTVVLPKRPGATLPAAVSAAISAPPVPSRPSSRPTA